MNKKPIKRNAPPIEDVDLQWMLSVPQGRRFVLSVLNLCGVNHDTFHESTPISSYLAGQRSVGLMLMQDILSVDPFAYANMISENIEAYYKSIKTQNDGEDDAEYVDGTPTNDGPDRA